MIIELLSKYSKSITIVIGLIGILWTLYRYFREGFHRPRIEFDIECNILGEHLGEYLAEFTIYAHNKGHIKFTFPEIRLRVRGIDTNSPLSYWPEHGKRLEFPIPVFNEKIIPPKFKYYFVEPGIKQPITYVTKIPNNIRFIVARASFKYRFKNKLHTSERVFELKCNNGINKINKSERLS